MTPDEPESRDAGTVDGPQFEQFTRRLIALARLHLDARLQHKIDPEDVVQSAYKSFFLRYGETGQEEDTDQLWRLLTVITVRKCADRVRYHRAERRDMAREVSAEPAADVPPAWSEAADREPTPEHAALLAETVEQLLLGLDADDRPILELSFQGYNTQEISQQLGRAERSVRRLRERVRKQLQNM